MRVPISSQQNTNSLKPNSCNSTNTNPNSTSSPSFPIQSPISTPKSCYEPTSVLDLRSPVSDKHPAATEIPAISDVPPISEDGNMQWDDHVLQSLDWESIMKDLGVHEDSVLKNTTNTQFNNNNNPCDSNQFNINRIQDFGVNPFIPSDLSLSEVYQNQNLSQSLNIYDMGSEFHNNWSLGFDFLEDLIQVADCVDSNELQLAQVILARLNQRLRSPAGKPVQRTAFYFKEALQAVLSGSNRGQMNRVSSWADVVQTIRAYKAFSGISPISMFTHFTANQALLESLDGSMLVHIIDFDIGFGGQYASFIKEIAERALSCKIHPPMIRITAIVHEEYAIESKLIKDNLSQFAQDLKIRFDIEFVLFRAFEMLSFKAIKFMEGENLMINLSPAIFHRLGSPANAVRFLGDVRRLRPTMVVFVDTEPWSGEGVGGAGSFRRSFMGCFEYYTGVLESLDAAVGGGGGGGGVDWVRKIEMFLLRPRILAAVEAAARRAGAATPWREVFRGAGLRAVQLSQFADYQAECLLGKVQVRGFQVAKRQAELVLCWHERALVATSAWAF